MLYLSRSGCTDLVQHKFLVLLLHRELLENAVFVRLQAAVSLIPVDIGNFLCVIPRNFYFQLRFANNIHLRAKYRILASIQPCNDIFTTACFQYMDILFSAWRKIKYSLFHRAIITI